VKHRVSGTKGSALAIGPVEEDVDVAAALMRLVLGRIAAAPSRQVTDRRDAARIATLDRARSAHDDTDQFFSGVVRVPRAPRSEDRVTVAVVRQLCGMPKRPVGVRSDRRASELERQRAGASAGDRSQNQSDDGWS